MIKILVFFAVLAFPLHSSGVCFQHVVETGDTLASISKLWFGNTKHAKSIAKYNNVQELNLKVGTNISVYLPDELDWMDACTNVILARLSQRMSLEQIPNVLPIISAIEEFEVDEGRYMTPSKKLELCKILLTISEHETLYRFRVGKVGEIGIYQFRLSTARFVVSLMVNPIGMTDEILVKYMLDPKNAAKLFLVLYSYLHDKHGSTWTAFYAYNGAGPMARRYANEATTKLNEISRIREMECNPEKIEPSKEEELLEGTD